MIDTTKLLATRRTELLARVSNADHPVMRIFDAVYAPFEHWYTDEAHRKSKAHDIDTAVRFLISTILYSHAIYLSKDGHDTDLLVHTVLSAGRKAVEALHAVKNETHPGACS